MAWRILDLWVPSVDLAQINGHERLQPPKPLARTYSYRRALTVTRLWHASWRLGTVVFEYELLLKSKAFLDTGLYSSNGSRRAHDVGQCFWS